MATWNNAIFTYFLNAYALTTLIMALTPYPSSCYVGPIFSNPSQRVSKVYSVILKPLFLSSSSTDESPNANTTKRTPRQPRSNRSPRSRSELSNRSRSNRNRKSTPSSTRTTPSSTNAVRLAPPQLFDPIQLTKEQKSNIEALPLDLDDNREEVSSTHHVISDVNHPITHAHIQTFSLDDLFPSLPGLNFSSTFNCNQNFREEMKQAMRMDVFYGNPQNEKLSDKVKDILLLPDSSLQGSWTQECITNSKQSTYKSSLHMPRLSKVISSYLGPNAPSGELLMSKLAHLCNPPDQKGTISSPDSSTITSTYHWIDIIGIKNRKISHSWHQDTAILPDISDSIYTVMLGFPPENNYCGTGVFSHAVRLQCPRIRCPLQILEDNDDREHNRMAGEPVLYTPSISEEFIIRPIYEPGKEILFYRDVDVLHSAPDVAYRSSVMRFMNIG